jgi:peptidyl-tRNA hydrolase
MIWEEAITAHECLDSRTPLTEAKRVTLRWSKRTENMIVVSHEHADNIENVQARVRVRVDLWTGHVQQLIYWA